MKGYSDIESIIFGLIVLLTAVLIYYLFNKSPKEKKMVREILEENQREIPYEPKDYLLTIFNETSELLITDERVKIEPEKLQTFYFGVKRTAIYLTNGVEFHDRLGEVEVVDPENQVSGLGGPYLQKYGIPKTVDFAFTILPLGEGDQPPS